MSCVGVAFSNWALQLVCEERPIVYNSPGYERLPAETRVCVTVHCISLSFHFQNLPWAPADKTLVSMLLVPGAKSLKSEQGELVFVIWLLSVECEDHATPYSRRDSKEEGDNLLKSLCCEISNRCYLCAHTGLMWHPWAHPQFCWKHLTFTQPIQRYEVALWVLWGWDNHLLEY